MFARIKKSGKYQYLQIVENRKEKGKVKQRVISTIGRMETFWSYQKVNKTCSTSRRLTRRPGIVCGGLSICG